MGTVLAVLLLLTYTPAVLADNTNENLVSTDNTTHAHEKSNEAFFIAPNNAVNGNNSEDNYTRIITSCWWYVGNIACEDGEYYITAVYTFSFSQSVEYVNLSSISKAGYLEYGDPWGLEMSISTHHKNGTDLLWSDEATPGYINTTTYQDNNSGPIPVRDNGTVSLEFSIRTNPFYLEERSVEIRLKEISATKVQWGCLDPVANNYSPNATDSDDSCDYDLDNDGVLDVDEIPGCTDILANNFNSSATDDDGSCDYDLDDDGVFDADEVQGCTDLTANNYQANATDEDGSCDYDMDDDGVLTSMKSMDVPIHLQTTIDPMQRTTTAHVTTILMTTVCWMPMRYRGAPIFPPIISIPRRRTQTYRATMIWTTTAYWTQKKSTDVPMSWRTITTHQPRKMTAPAIMISIMMG